MPDEFDELLEEDEPLEIVTPEEIASLPLVKVEVEEVPPEPPLAAPAGGPSSRAWVRLRLRAPRIPSEPATRSGKHPRQGRVRPLPLDAEATAGGRKRSDLARTPGFVRYTYLLRKATSVHGAPHPGPQDYCDLLLRHGFTMGRPS